MRAANGAGAVWPSDVAYWQLFLVSVGAGCRQGGGGGTGSLVFPEDTAGARNRDARDSLHRVPRGVGKSLLGACNLGPTQGAAWVGRWERGD